MLCRGQKVTLYTLNGEFILEQNVGEGHEDYVSSCAFYEGVGNEWLENNLLFTGQRNGVVNIWRKVVNRGKDGKWRLELVKRLEHRDDGEQTAVGSLSVPKNGGGKRARSRSRSDVMRGGGGNGSEAAITCVCPMAQCVYTGDEDGRVVSFLPSHLRLTLANVVIV